MLAGYQATLETQKVRQQIQKKQAWEELLKDILDLLWQNYDLEAILPTILTKIQHFFQGENVLIWQQENQNLITAESAKYPLSSEITEFITNFTPDSQYIFQYQQQKNIAIAAVNQSKLLPTLEIFLANFRIAIAPIIIHNQFWG
jgi:GAF domain-containing protein